MHRSFNRHVHAVVGDGVFAGGGDEHPVLGTDEEGVRFSRGERYSIKHNIVIIKISFVTVHIAPSEGSFFGGVRILTGGKTVCSGDGVVLTSGDNGISGRNLIIFASTNRNI
jgi:hypothetical protein